MSVTSSLLLSIVAGLPRGEGFYLPAVGRNQRLEAPILVSLAEIDVRVESA
jgi:hypothetical protein